MARTVQISAPPHGAEIFKLAQDGEVRSVAFSPDSQYVAAGGLLNHSDMERKTRQTAVLRLKVNNTGPISKVTFSQDGKLIASADTGTARVRNVATGKEIFRKKSDEPVNAIAFSPDGKYLVSNCDPFSACLWDISNNTEIARISFGGAVTSAAFSPDGKFVVSGSRDNTARVWEAMTGKEQVHVNHDNGVLSVSFSPKGFDVISASSDFTARV